MPQAIHNFCIIAHIDHGKSTLADRMLELTGTIAQRQMRDQVLDAMDLERERGITIKLQPVKMSWQGQTLNLIDTPGHVDFQYEVSRSLAAVEGAVLLVDATQGVQAQTLSNLYLALALNLTIIPVINKIDLPAANVEGVAEEIVKLLGGKKEEILRISAKTGAGAERLLDLIAEKVPAAKAPIQEPLRALIFDSVYNDYKGVVAYVRVAEGQVKRGDELKFIGTGASDRAVEVGIFTPAWEPVANLSAGEIGYIATGLKEVRQARVGDTITVVSSTAHHIRPLAGFDIPQPKVFAGVYPQQGDDFPRLREAIGELQLNDASLFVQSERSEALGQGYRCGFLGMLHLDIVRERLSREHDLDLVVTTPSVKYKVLRRDGKSMEAATPAEFPDPSVIEKIEEQYAEAAILAPVRYVGAVFSLMKEREAQLTKQDYWGSDRVELTYVLPLRELVVDLYDQLKSVTSGYGSLSYELKDWRPAQVVKLNILINHEPVEALSVIVAQSKSQAWGKSMVAKLKEVIPKQLFAVPIQAAIGGKVIARETVTALRKDVTGYLYGGDVTRKRKLLEKQKKGKKKLAGVGKVVIPPAAYIEVLKR